MQDTCKQNCKIYKKLKLKSIEECPNHIKNIWTNDKDETILTNDCAPVRTCLMFTELYKRLIGIQKTQEQLRNETTWMQVVAKILGKNSGVDLAQFVEERQRLQNIKQIEQSKGQTAENK